MSVVLVCSGYNKVTLTGCLTSNKHLFCTVLEAGSLHGWAAVKAFFQVADSWFVAVSSHGGWGCRALWSPFYKGTNPIHEGFILMTNHLPKAHLLILSCCSVTKSCPTLCDPMNCSTPGFPVLCCLLEFAQILVHWVSDASNHLILCCPLLLLPSVFPNITVFSNECSSHQVAQVLELQLNHLLIILGVRVQYKNLWEHKHSDNSKCPGVSISLSRAWPPDPPYSFLDRFLCCLEMHRTHNMQLGVNHFCWLNERMNQWTNKWQMRRWAAPVTVPCT